MTENPIKSNLSNFIASQILNQPDRIISSDEHLIPSGLIDSFNLVDLALYIEDSFSVHIDDTELNTDTFDTLEELTSLIIARKE